MKKATTALAVALLLYFSPSAFAQYIFQEDFNTGIPGTWTLIDVDGNAPDSILPLPSIIDDAWVAVEEPLNAGNFFAASTSKYLPAGQANDWLITPAIITQSNSLLIWHANAFIPNGDGYQVRISTTTPTVNGFLAHPPLLIIGTESVGWTKRSADLSGYANQTVYLAFRNNSTDKYVLGIDDVKVFDCATIGADAGIIDTGSTLACAGFSSLDLNLVPSFSSGTTTNIISGNTNVVPNWNPLGGRPFPDGGCCAGLDKNPPYQLIEFQVTATGTYNVNQIQTGYDGVMYIYTDPLDLTVSFPQPTTFVAGNDDEDPDVGPNISEIVTVTLTQGVTYYLISTGYENGNSGNYTTTFTGPGSLIVQDPAAANSPFDYDFVVSNSNGIIVSIGDDLSNTTTFPGSASGDTFTVCGISYVSANLNLAAYVGLPYSVLFNDINTNSCAELTNDCYTAIIKSGGTLSAGVGDTVCAGTPVFLHASGALSYQWSTTDTTANIEVIPFYTTTYSVTAVDGIGCLAVDEVTVQVFSSDGGKFRDEDVKACEGEADLNLAPNPAYTKNFLQAPSNVISGSTQNYVTWDPLPGRPFADGTCCSGHNPMFDIQPFQVSETGHYTFNQSQAGYDGIMYLYTDPFDIAANPPSTFITGNDDGPNGSNTSGFDTTLQASTTYYLVSTGFSILQYGNYITAVTGPGNVLLPVAPDTVEFGYAYLTVQNGTITAFNKDLTNATNYPGSVSGTSYQVCAVSYVRDSINISAYLNQPFANLSGVTCLDPSANCINVTIFTEPIANAGPDDSICANLPYTMAGNTPAFGIGTWDIISGDASFFNFRDPFTIALLDTGLNVLTWTIDNGGCADIDTVEIRVTTPAVNAGPDDTICIGQSTTLTATGGGPYAWSTGDSTATAVVTPDETTTYIVYVAAANGCSATDEVTVTVNPPPVIGLPDATVCLGGTTVLDAGHPGSVYLWSTGDTTQTIRVTNGAYFVTVTDPFGCTNNDTADVGIGVGLTVVLDDVILCDGDTASFNAGNPGTNYTWSTGDTTQVVYVTTAGTYSVTVADATGCSGTDSATVVLLPAPQLTVSNDETICAGETVTLTASGTGTLKWSTTDTIGSITVSPQQSETYSVTVTGGNGCSVSDEIEVTVNPIPNADAGPDNITLCSGDMITLFAAGGTSYLWNTGATSVSIDVSPEADTTYIVTVSDLGCFASDTVNVVVNSAAFADAGVGDTICAGESTTLHASGGGTYLWQNGNANSSITITLAFSEYYNVTVTAPNGCQASDSAYVLVNESPSADFDVTTDLCLGTSVTLSVSGGDTFLWSTNATTASIDVSPTTDQTYSVTATANGGCSITASTLVHVVTAPVANAGADTAICEGSVVELTASGGNDYHWSTGSNDNPLSVSPTITTTYSVTVANAAGCEDVDDVTVTVNDVVEATLFGFDTTLYCIDHVPIIIQGSPTGGTITGAGVANGQFSPKNAGAGTHPIIYTLTQPNGCSAADTVNITVDPCLGIGGMAHAGIKIYPNPTENFITVEATGLKDEVTIRLFDPLGRLLLSDVVLTTRRLDLSAFAPGTYLLQITGGNETIMKKVVKNN